MVLDLVTTIGSGVVQVQSLEFYIVPSLDDLSQATMNITNSSVLSSADREEDEGYKIQYEIYTKRSS